MSHIHLYMNNPTAGGVDGTEISAGDETLPLTFTLDASHSETGVAKCAIRCESGYSIEGGATIYAEGTNSDSWTFAYDNNYSESDALVFATWESQIVLSDVATTNTLFWVKATTSTPDNAFNDRTVDIIAEGHIVVTE